MTVLEDRCTVVLKSIPRGLIVNLGMECVVRVARPLGLQCSNLAALSSYLPFQHLPATSLLESASGIQNLPTLDQCVSALGL